MSHDTMPNENTSIDDLFSAHRDAPVLESHGDMHNDKYDMPAFLRRSPAKLQERLVRQPAGGVPNDDNKYDIPPFLRLPPIGSMERLEMTLSAIDRRFSWLAERGIRPSSSAIEIRGEIAKQLGIFSRSPEKVGAGGMA